MTDLLSRRSALAGLIRTEEVAPPGRGRPRLELSERTGAAVLRLHGPADAQFVAAVAPVLGIELPLRAGCSAGGDDLAALWVGPGAWLLRFPLARLAAVEQGLRAALEGRRGACVDWSSSRTIVRLEGPAVREVLAADCPLDLARFVAGHCAQTLIAQASVTLHAVADDVFDLYLPRSFAPHVWEWLLHAAAAHGYRVSAG